MLLFSPTDVGLTLLFSFLDPFCAAFAKLTSVDESVLFWPLLLSPILDKIDRLSDDERKALLEILSFDVLSIELGEKDTMESSKAWELWSENLLTILDEIKKLSYAEKKDLLELLSIDLEERDETDNLNWDEFDEEMLRDLISNITSDFYILDGIDKLSHIEKKDLFELLSIELYILELEENSKNEQGNWAEIDEKKLRDLLNDVISQSN